MEPKFLDIPKVDTPVKATRKYTKKKKSAEKNVNLIKCIGEVFEPNKKKLKLDLLQKGPLDNKVLKKIEAVEKLDEKHAQRKMTQMETEQLQKLSGAVASGFCTALGHIFDVALRGNGHIRKEFNNDKALEFAFAKEVTVITALLSNRAKILLCSGNDIGKGFMNARLKPPLIEQISETNENIIKENGTESTSEKNEGKGPGDSWATG
jgi:hypothetical protein